MRAEKWTHFSSSSSGVAVTAALARGHEKWPARKVEARIPPIPIETSGTGGKYGLAVELKGPKRIAAAATDWRTLVAMRYLNLRFFAFSRMSANSMNRYERRPIAAGEAEVEYLDGEFRILRPGAFVRCAATGVRDSHRGSALLECRSAGTLRRSRSQIAAAQGERRRRARRRNALNGAGLIDPAAHPQFPARSPGLRFFAREKARSPA